VFNLHLQQNFSVQQLKGLGFLPGASLQPLAFKGFFTSLGTVPTARTRTVFGETLLLDLAAGLTAGLEVLRWFAQLSWYIWPRTPLQQTGWATILPEAP
jgi:hypothetical protein